jgi:hypothetical protein
MNTTFIKIPIAVFACVAFLQSCENHAVSPVIPEDYFPLKEGIELNYYQENTSTSDPSEIWNKDTVHVTISKDTIIEGIQYKRVLNNFGRLEKFVRKEGTQYFGRQHEFYGSFTPEYMFLDTSVPVNGSWTHIKNEGHTKTEYVVKSKGNKQTIHGVEYNDVIELDVNYYNDYNDGVTMELLCTAKHFYANGVGEIFTYYPYPVSEMFSNVTYSLLPKESE